VCELLPKEALKKLRRSTKFWVNKCISYGPSSQPIKGHDCTYHPKGGGEWLRKNGLREDKAGGIEIYCADDYLRSRGDWGTGGCMLHELAHAYHDKHCSDGFSCEAWQDVIISTKTYLLVLKF
jgi:hypothetical protein